MSTVSVSSQPPQPERKAIEPILGEHVPGRFYRHIARVSGVGEFPVDMLRYDCCFPRSEVDSFQITNQDTLGDRRVVFVVTLSSHKTYAWTRKRWESFGWDLQEVSQ